MLRRATPLSWGNTIPLSGPSLLSLGDKTGEGRILDVCVHLHPIRKQKELQCRHTDVCAQISNSFDFHANAMTSSLRRCGTEDKNFVSPYNNHPQWGHTRSVTNCTAEEFILSKLPTVLCMILAPSGNAVNMASLPTPGPTNFFYCFSHLWGLP